MHFIILLSCLIYIAQIKVSSSSICSESTESLPSNPRGHTSRPSTNDADIVENDFLNRNGEKIFDILDQVILHTTTSLRISSIAMRNRNKNVENDADSDRIGQINLKKTCSLKRGSSQTLPATNAKPPHKSIKKNVSDLLRDETNAVEDVLHNGASVVEQNFSQEQPAPQVNRFEELTNQRRYKEIFRPGTMMINEKFSRQLCSAVKTFEQYEKIACYLKRYKMVASFYVHGDIAVVKRVIVESRVYDSKEYAEYGDLEVALLLILKDDHDRFIELLSLRMGITAEKDKQFKPEGEPTSFETFVSFFLRDLAPWMDGTTLKRFLILRGDELRNKHPDILDTLCQELVYRLKLHIHPNTEKLLAELIGQPSLLTPVTFAKGFLRFENDRHRSAFIKYAWDDAMEEGLRKGCSNGNKELWLVMKREYPTQFSGGYPSTAEALVAVLKHFPKKQELEEQWANKNAGILYNKLKSLEFVFNLLPNVLWSIIASYAISWTDI